MEAFAISATTISPLSSSFKPRFSLLNPSLNPNRNNLRLHRCTRRPVGVVMTSGGEYTSKASVIAAEGDAFDLLLNERIVFLGTEIDDFVADAVISQLLLLDAIDPTRDIRLFIHSTGGNFSSMTAIFDVMRLIRADVSTIALGIVASTSSIILGGGTKGKRLAMPNTRIMIHQPLGGVSGIAEDVEVQVQELMHNKNSVIQFISEFSGRPVDQVEKDIDRDRFMSPIEAVEYGIIDGVIDRDIIIPLEPIPKNVKGTLSYAKIREDLDEFLTPDIPDDELY